MGALALCGVLSACGGDPLSGLGRLSDVEVASSAQSAQIAAQPVENGMGGPGFLGRLFGGDGDPRDQAEESAVEAAVAAAVPEAAPESAETVVADAPSVAGEVTVASAEAPDTALDAATAAPAPIPVVAAAAPASERGGFLGGLFRGTGERAEVTPAAVGTSAPRGTGPDAQLVEAGTVLPFGEIATVCGVRGRALGTQIGSVSGLTLYDTIPNTTALRPFYITGFPDGCARTVTASVAIWGDVGTHEVVRYQPHNSGIPFNAVDTAYEDIKAQVCRVGHGTPCGARLERLGQNTTFLTLYSTFGGARSWVDVLFHGGEVVAIDRKAG